MTDPDPDPVALRNERYLLVEHATMRRIERRVIGADFGATSYTTVAQADRMAALLDLRSGDRMLDIGSGAGWPAIRMAQVTGASVVLTDIPVEGLRVAHRRLGLDGSPGYVLAAAGEALPFRDATFDAVTSSDVFC